MIAEQSPQPAQEPHEDPPVAASTSSAPGTGPQGGGIDPIQAVVSGFTRCMELGGRSSRSEFWWFYLFTGSVFLLTFVVDVLIGTPAFIFLNVLILWPYIAVGVRRLHDSGRNGWLILIGLVPLFGWIVVLVWWVSPSNEGSNRYGPNPNQRTQNPQQTLDRETPSAGHQTPASEPPSAALLAMVGETPIVQEPTPEHRIPPDVNNDEPGPESAKWTFPEIIGGGCLVVVLVITMVVLVAVVISLIVTERS